MNYLKDMKTEALSFVATPVMTAKLEDFGIKVNPQGFFELAKMTREQCMEFRNCFVEDKMGNEDWLSNKNEKAMELLLSSLSQVICKKVPAEIPCPPTLHTRVRLVPHKAAEKPEKCIVRLTVPQKRVTTAEKVSRAEEDGEDKKPVKEFEEIS